MRSNIADIIGIIGMAAICIGVAMFNKAASIILAGIFCMMVSFFIHRSQTRGGAK